MEVGLGMAQAGSLEPFIGRPCAGLQAALCSPAFRCRCTRVPFEVRGCWAREAWRRARPPVDMPVMLVEWAGLQGAVGLELPPLGFVFGLTAE